MLEVLQLLLALVVVGEQLLDQVGVLGSQGLVVGVATEDVLEEALDLVDVGVLLAPELELLDFLAANASCRLLFGLLLLVVVFPQVVDDAVVVVAVLLPELVQRLALCLLDGEDCFAHFEPFLLELSDELWSAQLLLDSEVSLVLVEARVGREHVVRFEQSLLDVAEGHFLVFLYADAEDLPGLGDYVRLHVVVGVGGFVVASVFAILLLALVLLLGLEFGQLLHVLAPEHRLVAVQLQVLGSLEGVENLGDLCDAHLLHLVAVEEALDVDEAISA